MFIKKNEFNKYIALFLYNNYRMHSFDPDLNLTVTTRFWYTFYFERATFWTAVTS